MKTTVTFIAICLACGLLNSGCQQNQVQETGLDRDMVNKKMLEAYSDMAIQNAIIAQHTLYPYHFVNNSTDLNNVGKRDLGVLIQHFQKNPGKLIVQRGAEEEALYQARLQAVSKTLIEAGIAKDKIYIADGMPGGDGMSSAMAIEILEKSKDAPCSGQSSSGGMLPSF